MEEGKEKAQGVADEIQPSTMPNVIVTKAPDSNRSGSSTSEPDDEREHDYIGSNSSFVESHSENEFTKASSSPYEPPSGEIKEKIRSQVEFYMSDENLAKDAFLLKHVRRHKEGFVNLKLITSFKKVKNLTKDYRVVAESLRESKRLVMNTESTKVRRKEVLPKELDERNPGRTIVATRLPLEEPSIEKVAEIFSKFGPIAVVRIIRNGKNVPPECKHHFVIHPELADEVCAIVEFETMAAAARACSELKQSSITVTELVRSKSTKSKKDKENQPDGVDSDRVKDSDAEEKTGKRRRKKKKDKSGPKRDKRLDELVRVPGDEGHTSSSDNENSFSSFSSYKRRYNSGSSDGQSPKPRRANQKGSPAVSSSSPVTSPEMQRRSPDRRLRGTGHSSDGSNPNRSPNRSPNHSPVMQRRLAAQGQSPLAADADHRMVQTLGVLRQPRGPDGTRGFCSGRGRVIGVSA